MKFFPLFFTIFFGFVSLCTSQEADPVADASEVSVPAAASTPSSKSSNGNAQMNELRSVIDSYRRLREQQRELTTQLPPEGDDSPEAVTERTRLQESLTQLSQNIETVKGRIQDVATGFSGLDVEKKDDGQFNLQAEIQLLLEPTMVELREATASTRQLTDLRGEELRLLNQQTRLQSSVRRLGEAKALAESAASSGEDDITEVLLSISKVIESDLSVTEANLAAIRFRLDELQKGRKPFHQQVKDSVASFFKGRGRSLLVAVLVALLSFYFLTFLHKRIFKQPGEDPKAVSSLGFRLAELAFTAFRFFVAIAAVFVVFLLFNDWLLVTSDYSRLCRDHLGSEGSSHKELPQSAAPSQSWPRATG